MTALWCDQYVWKSSLCQTDQDYDYSFQELNWRVFFNCDRCQFDSSAESWKRVIICLILSNRPQYSHNNSQVTISSHVQINIFHNSSLSHLFVRGEWGAVRGDDRYFVRSSAQAKQTLKTIDSTFHVLHFITIIINHSRESNQSRMYG